jgi:hypothetical protein
MPTRQPGRRLPICAKSKALSALIKTTCNACGEEGCLATGKTFALASLGMDTIIIGLPAHIVPTWGDLRVLIELGGLSKGAEGVIGAVLVMLSLCVSAILLIH